MKNSIQAFKDYLNQQDLSEITIRGYLHDIELFWRWVVELHGQEIDLKEISTVDLKSYRQYLVNVQNQKPSSINRKLQSVKRLFRWAQEKGLANDISQQVRFMRSSKNYQPKALSTSEVHALFRLAGQSCHGLAKRNYALLQLMLQTGLRVSEVVKLRIGDLLINERSGSVFVRDSKGHTQREVPLNAAARRALTTYLQTRTLKKEDLLFHSKKGQPLSLRAVQEVITVLGRKAKLSGVSAHTLRHTFAVNYLKANQNNLVELANLLGHQSLDTTAIYLRPAKEKLAEDLERSSLNVY